LSRTRDVIGTSLKIVTDNLGTRRKCVLSLAEDALALGLSIIGAATRRVPELLGGRLLTLLNSMSACNRYSVVCRKLQAVRVLIITWLNSCRCLVDSAGDALRELLGG